MTRSPLFLDESIPIVRDGIKENIKRNEKEEEENSVIDESNDQIECTPVSKTIRKLGVSKLYNVDTTLLQNGKKLRQSTLTLFPDKQSVNATNNSMYNKSKCFKSRISLTPEKNEEMNKSRHLEEEIIQRSPNKSFKSQFRKRSLQLKRKLIDTKADDKSDKFTDKSNSNTKPPVSETNQFKHDQYPSTTHTSKRKTKSYNRSIEKSNDICLNSHALSNAKNLPDPVQEIKKEIITQMEEKEMKKEIITQMEEREIKKEIISRKEENTCSDLSNQMLNANSSQNDETFFDIEEQGMEKFSCNKNVLKAIENNGKQEILPKLPPLKKRHVNKFDFFPEKEVCYDKVSRKQSERKKLNGVTCWECKQYYEGLGLSEEEIVAKKNQCSRHRTAFPERPDTPEGFWNHLFPDTLSSTYAE